ncbi:MAG: hypothetical protein EA393_08390 [Bacteroidetes bacterium]|nr:MAG: hypothetical protein EA393_08390 [Bacteroidota bacterium]
MFFIFGDKCCPAKLYFLSDNSDSNFNLITLVIKIERNHLEPYYLIGSVIMQQYQEFNKVIRLNFDVATQVTKVIRFWSKLNRS